MWLPSSEAHVTNSTARRVEMLLKEAGLHHKSRGQKENSGQARVVAPDLGRRLNGRDGEAGSKAEAGRRLYKDTEA